MTYTGYLKMEVEKKQKQSVISDSFYDGVLKITRPSYSEDGLPLLTLIHVGGGYVDGDSYKTEIVMNEFSRLAVTTQASTKVYKSPRFGAAHVSNYFLKDGSELYVKQDSLIPYKDAKFTQSTNVYMSSTATFSYTDIVTPGWSEDGRLFQYEKVVSRIKIFVDGELKVFDSLLLQPHENLHKLLSLEGFTHVGTMLFIHKGITESLIVELRKKSFMNSHSVRVGVSLLGIPGLSLRILATSTPLIEAVFSQCAAFLRERLFGTEEIEWRKG